MSILIKGMEMPFAGSIKTIVIYPDGTVRTRRQDPLPYTAVPVPEHGRLIDADDLANSITGAIYHSDLRNAPTIIPAEPAEEGET